VLFGELAAAFFQGIVDMSFAAPLLVVVGRFEAETADMLYGDGG